MGEIREHKSIRCGENELPHCQMIPRSAQAVSCVDLSRSASRRSAPRPMLLSFSGMNRLVQLAQSLARLLSLIRRSPLSMAVRI